MSIYDLRFHRPGACENPYQEALAKMTPAQRTRALHWAMDADCPCTADTPEGTAFHREEKR